MLRPMPRQSFVGAHSMLAVLIALVLSIVATTVSAQERSIRCAGTVVDDATDEPLRFVTIRLRGTGRMPSTISDRDGRFVLATASAVPDSIEIIASLIGYRSDTVVCGVGDTSVVLRLEEVALRVPEVVVTSQDPAVQIMRGVLKRKQQQMESLQQYSHMLYTKLVITTDTTTAMRSSGRGDTSVFSILETYSRAYVDPPDRFFNQIIQRRQTANIPPQANIVAIGTTLNTFDDELTVIGERMQTPFHPDALEDFTFVVESSLQDTIVRIRATARSARTKALQGTIFVDQFDHRPLEVRLRPTPAVNLPFDASLSVRQTFTDAASDTASVVVPEALWLSSSLTASVLFVFAPRLDVDLTTFCYEYQMNDGFSADVFDQRRVEALPSAETFDSVFWQVNEKLPLRSEESRAYVEIQQLRDNPDSASGTVLEGIFGELAVLANRLNREPFSTTDDVFRYNRIHGAYVGMGLWFRPDTALELRLRAGYGTEDRRWYGFASGRYFPDRSQRWSIDGSVYSELVRRDNPYGVRQSLITATTLLFGNDYGDYYYADGWEAGASYAWGQLRFIQNGRFGRPNNIRAYVRSERHATAISSDVWSAFGRSVLPRENPAIEARALSTVGAEIFLNDRPERRISRTGMSIAGEATIPGEAFFSRVDATGFFRLPTLPLFTLDVQGSFGWTWGDVPPQKFFSLESAVSGIAVGSAFRVMRVKEFYGDRYAALSLAHNWGEVIPGLLRIPNVASFGIEFITFGSVGWTQFSQPTRDRTATDLPSTAATRDGLYYEVGLGINRLLLFFRTDINVRLSQTDQPQWRLTITGATF